MSELDELRKKIREDRVRLYKLDQIIKEYNLVGFVKAYNEAKKRGWSDIRIPIVYSDQYVDPSELEKID